MTTYHPPRHLRRRLRARAKPERRALLAATLPAEYHCGARVCRRVGRGRAR